MQKAFDVVSHESLLRKLHMEGLPSRWWQLKQDAYQDMTTKVMWKGEIGEPYSNLQGNRQGGKSSASDFKIYIIDIIRLLKKSLYGSHIGDTYTGVIACADDLILAASTPEELFCQIALVNMYANQERFIIHPQKSSIAIKGISDLELKFFMKHNPWSINNVPITIANEFTHLGVQYNMESSSITTPTIDSRLNTARKTTYALMGSGFHGVKGLKPSVSLHIFETYVIPRMTYSLEALNISTTDMKRLEVHQRSTIRQLQSLPTRSANCALYILFGILPIEARIDKMRMTVIISLLQNPIFRSIIPRQIATKSIDSNSWFIKTQQLLRKYNLPSIIDLLQNTPPKQKWKESVKREVEKFWKHKIEAEAEQKSTLRFLSCSFNSGNPHNSWKLCSNTPIEVKKAAIKVKLMTNTYTLQANRSAFNQTNSSTCPICKEADEDVTHFVTTCPVFENIRKPIINSIFDCVPYVLSNHPSIWSKDHLCHLILDHTHPNINHIQLTEASALQLEQKARHLCYSLHKARERTLQSISSS